MTLYTILTILIVLVCLLILLVVLVQDPKGGGLGGSFGGVSSNSLGGARNAADFLEKATWGLIVALLVFSLLSATVIDNNSAGKNGVNKQLEQDAYDFDPNNVDLGE